MGRVTLSVPDSMQTRIQADKDGLNFSLLAREAFTAAFGIKDASKLGSTEETIERLRQSKRDAKASRKKEMRLRARSFVRDRASFYQLKVLEDASFDMTKDMEAQLVSLFYCVEEEPQEAQDWKDSVLGAGFVSNADVLEFLSAVGEIWMEIKDRVEAED